MTMTLPSAASRTVPGRALGPFFLITFGLAWGVFTAFAVLSEPLERIFGPPSGSHPLFILAVYAPAIAAFGLVFWHAGVGGLGRYLSRLALWRMPGVWWVLLLIGIPLAFGAGAALKGNLIPLSVPFESLGAALGAMAFMAVLGPVEEFGWRGLALPILQRRMAPIWAGLVLGAIWGVWHLPAFFLSGTPQSAWGFLPFFIASVSVSVILTAMFNAARGSLLVACAFHFQLNNPLWPDAQPWDTWVFLGAAVLTVWFCRDAMFRREGAVTVVVPDDAAGT